MRLCSYISIFLLFIFSRAHIHLQSSIFTTYTLLFQHNFAITILVLTLSTHEQSKNERYHHKIFTFLISILIRCFWPIAIVFVKTSVLIWSTVSTFCFCVKSDPCQIFFFKFVLAIPFCIWIVFYKNWCVLNCNRKVELLVNWSCRKTWKILCDSTMLYKWADRI